MSQLLSVKAMATGYAGQPVVRDVTFDVEPGEVVCLLGPNGAGKTSTLLAVSGELPLLAGEVMFDGTTGRLPLHKRARRGLAYVTEERSVFKSLTLAENLRCGGVTAQQAFELFPELENRIALRAGHLSGGEQQMLTLARALARKPKLLLADELSLGLAPLIVDRLLEAVRAAADAGTGVLMVEQHAQKALKHADRVLVMRRGTLEMSLTAEQARKRLGDIEDAYLSSAITE